ncbi:MAG TPA: Wzz/FepE/Etk N-terminal domain-containing protein [Vicinamibacterales bacterium]
MRERELELIDYIDVLWRWRWLIVTMTGVAVLAAVLAGMRVPASYTATTIVDAGTPRDRRQEDAVRQITSDLQRKWEATPVAITTPAPGRVRLAATAPSPAAAEQLVGTGVADVRNTLGRLVTREQERRTMLERELEELRTLQSSLRAAQLKSLERPDAQGTLFLQLTSAELQRNVLRTQAIEDELQGAVPSLVETAVLVSRTQGVSMRLLVVVALIVGAAFSVILAFLLDYIRATDGRRPSAPVAAGSGSFRG